MTNRNQFNLVNVRQMEGEIRVGTEAAGKLTSLPLGSSILFTPSPRGGLEATVSPTPPNGWRIKWNQVYIYLCFSQPDDDRELDDQADQALAMLTGLVKSGFLVMDDRALARATTDPTSCFRKLVFWESAYHYLLGPDLAGPLERQPVGAAFLSSHLDKNSWRLTPLDRDQSGWRLKGGAYYIYADVEPVEIPGNGPPQMPPRVSEAIEALVSWGGLRLNREDILDYWSAPMDGQNRAEEYLKPVGRSLYLQGLIEKYCPPLSTALEIGCNVGRNMNHLQTELGLHTAGMEISARAIKRLRQAYPALAESKIYLGDVVERIKDAPDKSYDLVYSMAVLMHLHPATPDSFWADLVRTAKKRIITIEHEMGVSERNWPRNYHDVLTPHGARQIHEEKVAHDDDRLEGIEGYQVRIFEV